MATILDSGLMEGFYLYCADSERAFRYLTSDREPRPLRQYTREMCYDVALSYSSEMRPIVGPLQEQLQERGVRAYWLDVEEDPDEPLWGVRFREAAFHSYYLVPVLSEHYLARLGTTIELFDLARMTVKHRSDEFFYTLLPLVGSHEELAKNVFRLRGEEAAKYDEKSFEWLRSHIMPLELSRGVEWLGRFFCSLAKNASGRFDSGFLDCLGEEIEFASLFQVAGKPAAELLIKSAMLTYHYFFVSDNGVMRYIGLGEPQPEMLRLADHPDPVGTVLSHLGLERRESE